MCAVFLYAKHRTLASAANPWLRAASSKLKSAATFVFFKQPSSLAESLPFVFQSFSEFQRITVSEFVCHVKK